jgi:hypothetical protein
VRKGVRVAGEVIAKFEHTEPRSDDLPGWLDMDVPDDRLSRRRCCCSPPIPVRRFMSRLVTSTCRPSCRPWVSPMSSHPRFEGSPPVWPAT